MRSPFISPSQLRVDADLVVRVDRRDAVLEIDDGAERRFENDVGKMRPALRADERHRIDHQLDMQAVLAQQHDEGPRPVAL